jgi:hypothetical protein
MGYEYCKKKYYFVINTEKSWPVLGLATGEPDVRAFDLGAPFLSSPSPPLSLSFLFILDAQYKLCIT